jgi:hypothetical protein
MIRISHYLFSITPLLLLVNLICQSQTRLSAGNSKDSISVYLNDTVLTLTNEKYVINCDIPSVILIRNDRNCHDCFSAIHSYLLDLKKELHIKYISLEKGETSVLNRKRNFYSTMSLLSGCDNYLCSRADNPSIFTLLNIDYTPVLILIKKGESIYVPYGNIFHGTVSVNEKVNTLIHTFFQSQK